MVLWSGKLHIPKNITKIIFIDNLSLIAMWKFFFILWFLISLGCLYACDMHYPVNLNNKRVYKLECNDNQIEFKAIGLMGTRYQVKIKSLKGRFDFYTDSLIIIGQNLLTKVPIEFEYDNRIVSGHQIIGKNKPLTCKFSLGLPHGRYDPGKVYILPSGFIMCDGKPLITDTIRIR